MQVTNQPYPTTSEQRLSFSEPGPEGPVVMVNLLKFRDQATCPDGTDSELSGREAFARYQQEAERLIEDHGGRDLFTGAVSMLSVGEVEELWDEIALAEFPSRSAFVKMTSSAEFQAIEHHRAAGLEGQLDIETTHMPGTLSITAPVT